MSPFQARPEGTPGTIRGREYHLRSIDYQTLSRTQQPPGAARRRAHLQTHQTANLGTPTGTPARGRIGSPGDAGKLGAGTHKSASENEESAIISKCESGARHQRSSTRRLHASAYAVHRWRPADYESSAVLFSYLPLGTPALFPQYVTQARYTPEKSIDAGGGCRIGCTLWSAL